VNISSVSSSLNQVSNSLTNSSGTGNGLASKPATQSFGQIVSQKLEEANIALRQTVAVRDKLIDAYKQIANMQI